jgi:hypothetical protein
VKKLKQAFEAYETKLKTVKDGSVCAARKFELLKVKSCAIYTHIATI